MIDDKAFKEYEEIFFHYFGEGKFDSEEYLEDQRDYRVELVEIFRGKLELSESRGKVNLSKKIKNFPTGKRDRLDLANDIIGLLERKLSNGKTQDYVQFRTVRAINNFKDDDRVAFVKHLSEYLYGQKSLEERINKIHDFLMSFKGREDMVWLSPSGVREIYSFYLFLSAPETYISFHRSMVMLALEELQGQQLPKEYGWPSYKAALDLVDELKGKLESEGWKPKNRDIDLIDIRQFLWTYYASDDVEEDDVDDSTDANTEQTEGGRADMSDVPLNLIMYGPPGTGKTYQTVNKAVEILDPDFDRGDRAALKNRFNELCKDGQIEMVTFHQSFSYEDFVEGLKAVVTEEGQISYEIEDGVFKKICQRDRSILEKQDFGDRVEVRDQSVWKMSLGNTRISDEDYIYEHCVKNNEIRLGHGRDVDYAGCDDWKNIKARLGERYEDLTDSEVSMLNFFKNVMKKGDFVIISDGNTKFRAIGEVSGEYDYKPLDDRPDFAQTRSITWHRVWKSSLPHEELMEKRFSHSTLNKPTAIDMEKLASLLRRTASPNDSKGTDGDLKRVIIIDEINRGNIASIFGELITLIEPGKRADEAEELEVKLPYSKESFSVPNNLYIIGTMNTADRSLALLDTALRRRFDFEEVPPNPDLIKGIVVEDVYVSSLLETINKRIELLYDRDHLIGHSFFMKLGENSTIKDLRRIFERNILPLLEEYFFEDWGKIRQILGDDRKKKSLQIIVPRFDEGEVQNLLGSSGESEGEVKCYMRNETALDDPDAYIGIYYGNQPNADTSGDEG